MILSQLGVVSDLVIALTASTLSTIGFGLFIVLAGVQDCFCLTFSILTEGVSESHRRKSSELVQAIFGVGVLDERVLDILDSKAIFGVRVFDERVLDNWIQEWKAMLFRCYLLPMMLMIIVVHVFVVSTSINLITFKNPVKNSMMIEGEKERVCILSQGVDRYNPSPIFIFPSLVKDYDHLVKYFCGFIYILFLLLNLLPF